MIFIEGGYYFDSFNTFRLNRDIILRNLKKSLVIISLFSQFSLVYIQIMQIDLRSKNIFKFIIRKDLFVKSKKTDIKNQYNFEKILGKGSFATVYLATSKNYPHAVRAIKVIKKEKVKNRKSLIQQVEILKQLDHPSIIKIYETFQDEKHLCLVLDYCQGGELFQRMEKNGSFSEKNARTIFTQMAKIIKYLHKNKICHRDLKPQNFLMDKEGSLEIKLIDFGISKKWKHNLKTELIESKQNSVVGTSYYIAPQVLARNYDQKIDVWSLGVILHILITGKPPFDGKNDEQILMNIHTLNYTLNIPQFKSFSAQLKDLIKHILAPANQRISIDKILVHPWIFMDLPQKIYKVDYGQIKKYTKFSKFKRIAVSFVASQLPQKQIHNLGNLFKQIDTDHSGQITIQELGRALKKQNQKISYQQLKEVMQFIDTDQNGKISYNQFIAACLQTSFLNNQKTMEHIFQYFDANGDGTISSDEFQDILKKVNNEKDISKNYIQELINEMDSDHDGKINYKQFLKNMRKS